VPLFWLAYRQRGRRLILQASSFISARLKASRQIDGIDAHFANGFKLERQRDVRAPTGQLPACAAGASSAPTSMASMGNCLPTQVRPAPDDRSIWCRSVQSDRHRAKPLPNRRLSQVVLARPFIPSVSCNAGKQNVAICAAARRTWPWL
jgi:hypothetical protein